MLQRFNRAGRESIQERIAVVEARDDELGPVAELDRANQFVMQHN